MPTRPVLSIVAVAASLGLAACGGGGGGGGSTPSTAAPASTTGGTGTSTSGGGQAAAGKQVFLSNGCGGCHTLAAAGASGKVGPDLDKVLPGKSAAFIRQSIVDPNAQIAKGYSAGVMPQDFAQRLSGSRIDAVVSFLEQNAGR